MAQTSTPKRSKKKTVAVNILNVAYVWDMSGSMGSCVQGTVEGTRSYLNDLRKQEAELVEAEGAGVFTRFSLTAFDTVFEQWIVDEPVAKVGLARLDAYQPRGGTALYDAIAKTITDVDSRLTGDRAGEKVLVVVMTDGGENSSQEYAFVNGGRQRIFDLIKAYEAKGNWTFVWLGSGPEALAEAAHVGVPAGATASFDSYSPASYAAMSSSLGSVTRSRRSGTTMSSSTPFEDAGEEQDYTGVDATYSLLPPAQPVRDWQAELNEKYVPKSGEVLDLVTEARTGKKKKGK